MRSTLGAIAVVGMLALTGCGADEASPSEESKQAASASPEASAEPTPEPQDGVAVFGETLTYEDGLSISISQPKPFKPSADADYDGYPLPKHGTPVEFTVTITNGSKAPVDHDHGFIDVTSAGQQLLEVGINDRARGMDGLAPSARILPGKKLVFTHGWYVMDPAEVSIDYTFGSRETSTFTTG